MRIVRGDLLDVKRGIIVQQCNCCTLRALGLAASIERRLPYCTIYKRRVPDACGRYTSKPDTPGTYELFTSDDGDPDKPAVVCLLTQWAPGKPGAHAARYPPPLDGLKDTAEQRLEWFHAAFDEFLQDAKRTGVDFSKEPVCVPWHIGCGLAGGVWEDYECALRRLERLHDVEFLVYRRPEDEE